MTPTRAQLQTTRTATYRSRTNSTTECVTSLAMFHGQCFPSSWSRVLHATTTETINNAFHIVQKRRNLRDSRGFGFSLTWNRSSCPDPPMACGLWELLESMTLGSRRYSIGSDWSCYRCFGGPTSSPACVGCPKAWCTFWRCCPWRQVASIWLVIYDGGGWNFKNKLFSSAQRQQIKNVLERAIRAQDEFWPSTLAETFSVLLLSKNSLTSDN